MLTVAAMTDEDLARALSVIADDLVPPHVFCEEAVHDWLRAHPGDLLRLRPWPEMGLEIGECPGCKTTLCVEVGQ